MDRYIGLDAHASSCAVAIVGPSGRHRASHVIETNARALISTIGAIPRRVYKQRDGSSRWRP